MVSASGSNHRVVKNIRPNESWKGSSVFDSPSTFRKEGEWKEGTSLARVIHRNMVWEKSSF